MLLAGSRPLPPPPCAHGRGGDLTHRENEWAGAHNHPAESGQQLIAQNINLDIKHAEFCADIKFIDMGLRKYFEKNYEQKQKVQLQK